MLCYRDRTFCNAKCSTKNCPTKLTSQVERQAKAWWGKEGAPFGGIEKVSVRATDAKCQNGQTVSGFNHPSNVGTED